MIASGSFLIGCALVAGMWHVHVRYGEMKPYRRLIKRKTYAERKKRKLEKRLEASPTMPCHYDAVHKRESLFQDALFTKAYFIATTCVENRHNWDNAKLLNSNELTPCINTSNDSGFANVNT